MGKIISSIWQTIDGVIDAQSMEHWFMPFDSESRRQYIHDTIHECEAMLYGRYTYQMLSNYWSQYKHNEFGIADKLNTTKKYLVSTTIKQANWGDTSIIDKEVSLQVQTIKNNTSGNILIQGSASIVNQLLKDNLVDELRLLVHPYISGSGKRLFEKQVDTSLKLIDKLTLGKGVVLLTYQGGQH